MATEFANTSQTGDQARLTGRDSRDRRVDYLFTRTTTGRITVISLDHHGERTESPWSVKDFSTRPWPFRATQWTYYPPRPHQQAR